MRVSRFLRQRRIFTLTLMTLLILIGVSTVSRPETSLAHPLGNFTVNRYSRIEASAGQVYLRYVLDIAEIPTFQERAKIDRDGDGQVSDAERAAYLEKKVKDLKGKLYLSINDLPILLETVTRELSFPAGQGGLSTLRLSLLLRGQFRPTGQQMEQNLYYRDDNYSTRLGWKEIVVQPGQGVSIISSTVPQNDLSNELRTYPGDLLSSPPEQQEARSIFVLAGPAQTNEPQSVSNTAQPKGKTSDLLTSLVTTEKLSFPVVVISLLVALGLGALHAMTPGHGKTIMAAYLVGTGGTAVHALFLGLTVTISHTLGVLGLGLVTLYASHLITPERLYPWLGLVSGGIVVAIGAWLLLVRIRIWQRGRSGSKTVHGHPHDHGHSHQHGPNVGGGIRITWRNLAALGVAGGLLPSASALIILLAALSLNRVGFGLLLILAFSAGMAGVLAGIGLFLVYARRLVDRLQFKNRLMVGVTRAIPLTTALVVLGSGLVVTTRAAFQIGLL